MKKRNIILIIVVVLLLVVAIENCTRKPLIHEDPSIYPARPYEQISVIGENNARSGIGDGSVEYIEDGSVGWLAYSAVDLPAIVDTHIAKTTVNSQWDGSLTNMQLIPPLLGLMK